MHRIEVVVIPMSIGENIKLKREAMGLSQKAMAEAIEICLRLPDPHRQLIELELLPILSVFLLNSRSSFEDVRSDNSSNY